MIATLTHISCLIIEILTLDIFATEIMVMDDMLQESMTHIQLTLILLRLRTTEDTFTPTLNLTVTPSLMKELQSTRQIALLVAIHLTTTLNLMSHIMILISIIATLKVMESSPVSALPTQGIMTTLMKPHPSHSLPLALRSMSMTTKDNTVVTITLTEAQASILSANQTSEPDSSSRSTTHTSTTATHLTTTGMIMKSEESTTTPTLVQPLALPSTDSNLESQLQNLTMSKSNKEETCASVQRGQDALTEEDTEQQARLRRQVNTFIERFAIVKLSQRYNCDKASVQCFFTLLFRI